MVVGGGFLGGVGDGAVLRVVEGTFLGKGGYSSVGGVMKGSTCLPMMAMQDIRG
jgi:hypothetical protein